MAYGLDGQTAEVEQALAGGILQPAGWFRFYFRDQRWEWSDQVEQMHGYEPGTVTPTTELILSHRHPNDRGRAVATIDDMIGSRQAFSTRHRIIDAGGVTRHVVVVGDQLRNEQGDVVGTQGFYVDVTPAAQAEDQDLITSRVAAIAARRGEIDQTKGMLMLVYGLDETDAFKLLSSLSQVRNVKLGLLAEQIGKDFVELGRQNITARSRFDQALLTAHLRVRRSADGSGNGTA